MQHQITDTLSVCINRKSRLKLAEYDLAKCAQLRESILVDQGVPTIKEKILDLLTQIEKESQKYVGVPSPGGGTDSPGKKSTNVGKKPSVVSNTGAIAALEDTGDELQHMQTPYNPSGAGRGVSNLGGGNDDDDSDGVEYLREQMLI